MPELFRRNHSSQRKAALLRRDPLEKIPVSNLSDEKWNELTDVDRSPFYRQDC
jgi:hypothetical protein